ncbi:MAG: Stalked cell differentiation-controlling protein [Pseudomonadota bacterium]
MKFDLRPDVFDNFVDAICIVNEDLQAVYFNPSFANLVEETSLASIRKKKVFELLQIEEFDWDRVKSATRTSLESPVREVPFRTKTREGRMQVTWKSVRENTGSYKVILYFKDVSLEEVLNRKYHQELEKKEETIKALDQHLFQISLIRDVLERTTTFDDPLVMLRNLFSHLTGILKMDLALYLKQDEPGAQPSLLAYSDNGNLDHRGIRDLSELIKEPLLGNELSYQTVGGYSWLSFRYLDDSERQKFFVFAKKAEFLYEDENLLETICEPLSFSMDNRELFKKAMTDEMTELYNHRYFKVRLENELREHGERKKTLGLMLLDVDHFKKVNDTYGHLVGDIVLKAMAQCLKAFCRSTDVPARYGGEEFAIIVPNLDEPTLQSIGERLRAAIESMVIPAPGLEKPLKITASIGLSVFPNHGKTPTDLIGNADEALYEAKRSGRNRVMLNTKVAA